MAYSIITVLGDSISLLSVSLLFSFTLSSNITVIININTCSLIYHIVCIDVIIYNNAWSFVQVILSNMSFAKLQYVIFLINCTNRDRFARITQALFLKNRQLRWKMSHSYQTDNHLVSGIYSLRRPSHIPVNDRKGISLFGFTNSHTWLSV